MQVNTAANNQAVISGIITHDFRPCPEKNYYILMNLDVKRLSGQTDLIPVRIPKNLAYEMKLHIGQCIQAAGRFASYHYHDTEGSHLALSLLIEQYIFLKDIVLNQNIIFLDGYIAGKPVLRTTPLGHTITDLMVAINYPDNHSDYIPCICWNRTAYAASLFPCGTHIHVWGRIQSREYLKKLDEQKTLIKTAYEVSIWKIEKIAQCMTT